VRSFTRWRCFEEFETGVRYTWHRPGGPSRSHNVCFTTLTNDSSACTWMPRSSERLRRQPAAGDSMFTLSTLVRVVGRAADSGHHCRQPRFLRKIRFSLKPLFFCFHGDTLVRRDRHRREAGQRRASPREGIMTSPHTGPANRTADVVATCELARPWCGCSQPEAAGGRGLRALQTSRTLLGCSARRSP